MQWIVNLDNDEFAITVEFNQLRPLSQPKDKRDRPHAAWDIAPRGNPTDDKAEDKVGGGKGIYAPEKGELAFLLAFRPEAGKQMPPDYPKGIFDIKGHFYFYDLYGSIIILKGESGKTHVMTHSWSTSLMNYVIPYLEGRKNTKRTPKRFVYDEIKDSSDDDKGKRFPFMFHHNLERPYEVDEKELIGTIGNAGVSSGSHIHYEIHEGDKWNTYAKRIDPKDIFPDVWEKHKDDHRKYYDMEEHKELWQSRQ